MQQFALMIESREPSVRNVIGFMDGVLLTSECTNKRLTQNALYCCYSCYTMVNNVFVYGPDGKVFFCAINYPGSWADGSLTARFLHDIKKRIGEYKICVDQGFPQSGEAEGILVGPFPNNQHDDWIVPCVINYWSWAIFTHRFVRQASGVCVDCRGAFLGAKNASRQIIDSKEKYWNQLSLFTILGLK
jgi:hypothetical protein